MANVCAVTGKKVMFGRNRSHSRRCTSRRFNANLQKKRFWSSELSRMVTLKVSAKGIKMIDKIGIDAALKKIGLHGKSVTGE